ncbi:MAG: hypothetical protein WAZ19_09845 [Anaerolineae bacterium]
MKTGRLASTTILLLVLLVGCVGPLARTASPNQAAADASAVSALQLAAVNAERTVQAGGEETFDFTLTNTSDQPVPVLVVLEHGAGERWRTSLCVNQQCLLGDGTKPSVSDPVILPPYLEQPFQAHLFVDAAAEAGDVTALVLRVESEASTVQAESITLRAQVVER